MNHRSNDYLAFLVITLAISATPILASAANTALIGNGTIRSDQEKVSSTMATNSNTSTTTDANGNTIPVVGRHHRNGATTTVPTDGTQPTVNSGSTMSTPGASVNTNSSIHTGTSTSNAGAGVGGSISTGGKK